MFERFTDRARRVLVLAQEEARVLNHSFIGTEHILLGLIREREGLAAQALESLDISLEAARDMIEQTVGPTDDVPLIGSPPFTPRAKKVLEFSLREAIQLGHNYIGTEHILLGLVREGEGVAAQVLDSLGADLPRVRQEVIELLAGYQAENPGDAGVTERAPLVDAPRCPYCGIGLTNRIRHRTLESRLSYSPQALDDDPGGETIADATAEADETLPIVLIYCESCGRELAGAAPHT